MTSNQINWLRYREDKRNNLATLEEQNRHNQNTEATEQGRVEVQKSTLAEQIRHNSRAEALEDYRNVSQNDHWVRSDEATAKHYQNQDAENRRSNLAQESLTAAQIQKDRDLAKARNAIDLKIGRERNEASRYQANKSASTEKTKAAIGAAASKYTADKHAQAAKYSADRSAASAANVAKINAAANQLAKQYDAIANDKRISSQEKQAKWNNATTKAVKEVDRQIAQLNNLNKTLDRNSREYIANKQLIQDLEKFKKELPLKWTGTIGNVLGNILKPLGGILSALGG